MERINRKQTCFCVFRISLDAVVNSCAIHHPFAKNAENVVKEGSHNTQNGLLLVSQLAPKYP